MTVYIGNTVWLLRLNSHLTLTARNFMPHRWLLKWGHTVFWFPAKLNFTLYSSKLGPHWINSMFSANMGKKQLQLLLHEAEALECKASASASVSWFKELEALASASASWLTWSFCFASASEPKASYPCLVFCHLAHTILALWQRKKTRISINFLFFLLPSTFWIFSLTENIKFI